MLSGNLEYLMSSLPNLSFGDEGDLKRKVSGIFNTYGSASETTNDLILLLHKEAAKFLSTPDFKRFQDIDLNTIYRKEFHNSKNKVIAAFSKFLFQLKTELKAYRLALKSKDISGKNNPHLIEKLSDHPLEAELQLLELQWRKLEDLSIGHYADFSALILYKLKLELLLQWWRFDQEAGFEVFQKTLIDM